VKGSTAHAFRQAFPELKQKRPCLWTKRYSVGTVGGVTIETVKKNVEGQKGKKVW
jgi:putative transposase